MGFWLWGCFEIDKVSSIGEHTLFGIPTTVKQIDYYYTCDTTDTTARLHIYTDKLAEGFGVIYRGGGDTFYDMFLRAARIDGVVYGDTTVVSVLDEGNRDVLKIIIYFETTQTRLIRLQLFVTRYKFRRPEGVRRARAGSFVAN